MTQPSSALAATSRTTTYVWLALSALTVLTWWLAPGHSAAAATASTSITVAVAAIGLIKSRLIIRYFMEVDTAPSWLKRWTDLWLVGLWGSVLVIYLAV